MTATVREVMSDAVVTVSKDKTLQEAVNILSKHKFSGLPVIDEDNKVVGVFSETDVVRYSEKVNVIPLVDVYGWISPHTDLTDVITLRKGMELLSTTKVEKIMTKKVITVNEQTPVAEAAQIMNKRNVNRLPVVDQENRIAGIVSRADLIRHMAK